MYATPELTQNGFLQNPDLLSNKWLFENLKGLLTPLEVSRLIGVSPKTIYDWKYRPIIRKVPEGLFVKFNRKLLIRTDILRNWILSQNR